MYSVEVVQDLATTVDPNEVMAAERREITNTVNRKVNAPAQVANEFKYAAWFGVCGLRGRVGEALANGQYIDPIDVYKSYVEYMTLGEETNYTGANEKVGLRSMMNSSTEARQITDLRNEIKYKRSFRNEVLSKNRPVVIEEEHPKASILDKIKAIRSSNEEVLPDKPVHRNYVKELADRRLALALADQEIRDQHEIPEKYLLLQPEVKEITDSFRTLESNRHRREAVARMFHKIGIFAPAGLEAIIEMTDLESASRANKSGKVDPTPETFAIGWVPVSTEIPRGMPLVKIISNARRQLSA